MKEIDDLTLPPWFPSPQEANKWFKDNKLTVSGYRYRLFSYVSALLPIETSLIKILDLGCGDGLLGEFLATFYPSAEVIGLETFIRENKSKKAKIFKFDGETIPFQNGAFDYILIINVLHHLPTDHHIKILLEECFRVCRTSIVIKDLFSCSIFDWVTLYGLDILGNWKFGVSSSGQYLNPIGWRTIFSKLQASKIEEFKTSRLLPFPLRDILGSRLDRIFHLHLD